MSWKSTSIMEEKLRFIRAWESGQFSVSSLCEEFGISRTTGHKLINRYEAEGEGCFEGKSRAPKNVPHKVKAQIEQGILELRKQYPRWGARKIKVLLGREFPGEQLPSETTIHNILSRHGLVKKRRRRGPKVERHNPKYESYQCNDIWSVDYKGEFRLGNRRYCYPLTIVDKRSRYLLSVKGHYHPDYESVKREYVGVFKENGLPQYIHSDNGLPFGSIRSVGRYTKLCYWLIDHGVKPLFSDPASPQQNGKHERMHRDLKAHSTGPVERTMAAQQRRMDEFVREYNEIRPHESLEMQTPASIYEKSDREYRPRIRSYDYDPSFKVLKVLKNGAIRWGGYNWVYISTAASRRYVGLEQLDNGIWMVWYRDVFLGYMDEKKINSREQYLRLFNQIV